MAAPPACPCVVSPLVVRVPNQVLNAALGPSAPCREILQNDKNHASSQTVSVINTNRLSGIG